jgi:hypothetical protein
VFSGGDPGALQAQIHSLRKSAEVTGAVGADIAGAAHSGASAVGDPGLAAAVDRFGAAVSGQMLALGAATAALGSFAGTMADQLTTVTGGGR